MRALYISLLLFAVLIACIIINVGFIHNCANDLYEAASNVSDESSLCELEKLWESRKKYIGLSISESHLDNISRSIVSARIAYENKNEYEFKKSLALILDAAEDIKRYERLSIENLF